MSSATIHRRRRRPPRPSILLIIFLFVLLAIVPSAADDDDNGARGSNRDDDDDVCRDDDDSLIAPKATSEDLIFRAVETSQYASGKPFGRTLDAGTGQSSVEFLARIVDVEHDLGVSEWTAVTAAEEMRTDVERTMRRVGLVSPEPTSSSSSSCSGLVVGNWADDDFCGSDESETFDTILVDYLVGSVDSFAPYAQYEITERLATRLNPGGRAYVVGLQPIPESGSDEWDVLSRTRAIRDAVILLAGERPYREYPQEWVKESLEKTGLRVVENLRFDIRYRQHDVTAQLNVARGKLLRLASARLAKEMENHIDEFERDARARFEEAGGSILSGYDYLVVAEKPLE